jgi:hypothetical protein
LDILLEAEGEKNSKASSSLSEEMKETVVRWIRKDECSVPLKLPTLSHLFKDSVNATGSQIDQTRAKKKVNSEIRQQAKEFRKQLSWTNDHYNHAVKILGNLSKLSAKHHKAHPITVIWEKLKEAGYMKDTVINSCLQASMSFSGISLSRNRGSLGSLTSGSRLYGMFDETKNGSIGNIDDNKEELTASIPEQLAITNDLLYEPTKQTISIQMKRLVGIGDADAAWDLIETKMVGSA